MKKILLLSDTHGHIDERIIEYAKGCDEIWHAGDIGDIAVADQLAGIKTFRAVYGNIDGQTARRMFPETLRFTCEEVRVFITHIAGYPGRYPASLKQMIKKDPVDLLICGHSHILKVIFDKELNHLHMNPGAAGRSGFHLMRTMLRFSIDGKQIKDLEVIELGKRGGIVT